MTSTRGFLWALCAFSVGCRPAATATATAPLPPLTAAAPSPGAPAVHAAVTCQHSLDAVALPGASAPLSLDYLFYEPGRARVWVPAAGTGRVAVFDLATQSFTSVDGFRTAEHAAHGTTRVLGPSSGTIGEGYAYIGDRASHEVCAVDLQSLRKGACLPLSAPPDGVVYVAQTHEVWVTAPSIKSVLILAASSAGTLTQQAAIALSGEPEGYAIDARAGRFLTNLEDANQTLSIDIAARQVKDTWSATCNEDGPRGIAIDAPSEVALVACTDHVQALDLAHQGKPLGQLECGPGLDNIDYDAATRLLYAASGKAARLTVARLGSDGTFTTTERCETAPGARNAVTDGKGNAYIADAQGARLLRARTP